MKLDVVVPTYNRSQLLQLTLASLLRAPVPAGLEVTVLVVDNNSKDDTAAIVEQVQATANLSVRYLRETKQGLSHSRNAGIAGGQGELIGFIDDDEEIEEHWYEVIAREFRDPAVRFIGGPYLPNWEAPAPDWLPPGYHAVIGASPDKPRGWYGEDFPGILIGGNAVVRREVFDEVGPYSTRLGRSGKGLLSEEDAEFYRRLMKAGLRGVYVPELAIFHFIPKQRLTRSYHRRWAYWRAVSQGMLDRELREPVTYTFGIPRHRIGRAVRSLAALPTHRVRSGGKGQAFADELAIWDLVGFIYGKHIAKADTLYSADAK